MRTRAFAIAFAEELTISRQVVSGSQRVNLNRKVEFLRDPGNHPGDTANVDVVETHSSLVFLTDRHAYKLKKPVCHEFLDFSTIEARRRDCERELVLSRPLAESVYLGVVALRVNGAGNLQLDGTGRTVDWLVKMRRLPADRMLDVAIAEGSVSGDDLSRLAAVLGRFHQAAAVATIDPTTFRHRMEQNLRADLRELCRQDFGLDVLAIGRIGAALMSFLHRADSFLAERVRAGRVVDGHGDLRPEHICLLPTPVIIDRVAFNDEFRMVDVVDELAFLALECERLGAPEIGQRCVARYAGLTDGPVPQQLQEFYMSRRAVLRARLAAAHIDDPNVADHPGWLVRARQYAKLAGKHADALSSISGNGRPA